MSRTCDSSLAFMASHTKQVLKLQSILDDSAVSTEQKIENIRNLKPDTISSALTNAAVR
jgi:hypothetical protein